MTVDSQFSCMLSFRAYKPPHLLIKCLIMVVYNGCVCFLALCWFRPLVFFNFFRLLWVVTDYLLGYCYAIKLFYNSESRCIVGGLNCHLNDKPLIKSGTCPLRSYIFLTNFCKLFEYYYVSLFQKIILQCFSATYVK